jgi:YidC/Oxa1 family membrane protein insertase
MPNLRIVLWFALIGSLWISYSTWVAEHQPPPVMSQPADTPTVDPAEANLPDLGTTDTSTSAPPAVDSRTASAPHELINVGTDVFAVAIDTTGGDIVQTELREYPIDKAIPDVPVRLLDYDPADRWVLQTGLRSAADGAEPNHLATYRAGATSYRLEDGQDELEVRLDWVENGALQASKIYRFHRGSYHVDLDLVLANGTGAAWRGAGYARMVRAHHPRKRSFMSFDTYSFTGPVLYNGERYEKLDFDEIASMPLAEKVTGGWLAGIQHHFLAAIVPPPEEAADFQAATRGEDYVLTALGPVHDVAAGTQFLYPLKLFIGPKLQDQLSDTAPELERTVDYGKLTVLAQPLFKLLSWVDDWVHNWGAAIIIVTMLIKLAFYKLTAMSGRSMAKMRKLAPRMKALQERHKDDRQALSQAMMELYKREKVNPAAGCLPVLIQMPFFFAFYWVLIESVELRQAPFLLWINDLSVADPFYVLPLFMGGAMFFQMRLNPAPPDPVQARVMQIMPLVFTGMLAFFPAGLALYSLTNTSMSILQQWRINTLVSREE